jgi:hypothetical protein
MIVTTPYNRLLKINFNLDVDRNLLVSLLENETSWISNGGRAFLQKVDNKILKSITSCLMDNTVSLNLINEIYKLHPSLKDQWGFDSNEMYQKSLTNVYFCRDLPGHITKIHLDKFRVPFTGMVYLTEKDDKLMSTYFYTDINKNNEFRMTTNYGDGWFQANMHDTWHEGGNNTNDIRYAIIIEIQPNWQNNKLRNKNEN